MQGFCAERARTPAARTRLRAHCAVALTRRQGIGAILNMGRLIGIVVGIGIGIAGMDGDDLRAYDA